MQEQVDVARAEMSEKWDTCTQEILEKLKVQEVRMQDIEMDHVKVTEFMKKFSEFQIKVNGVIRVLDQSKELPKQLENSIPLMVHFQVSEGLHHVLNDVFPNKVTEYDMHKIKELTEFNQNHAHHDANWKALSSRLRLSSKYYLR